jgi:hypothetical protein
MLSYTPIPTPATTPASESLVGIEFLGIDRSTHVSEEAYTVIDTAGCKCHAYEGGG